MRCLIASSLCVLALAAPAMAQPSLSDDPISFEVEGLTNFRLPVGRRCEVNGETFQCFDLQEYRVLLQMDVDLRSFQLQLTTSLERVDRLERALMAMNRAVDGYEEQVTTLQAERARLYEQWAEENRLRLLAENKPAIGSWIAWSLAAVEAAVILGLVLAGLGG